MPGLLSGSYVTPDSESVTAALIFRAMSSALSVIKILDFSFGLDLDIFSCGRASDIILLAGAVAC